MSPCPGVILSNVNASRLPSETWHPCVDADLQKSFLRAIGIVQNDADRLSHVTCESSSLRRVTRRTLKNRHRA